MVASNVLGQVCRLLNNINLYSSEIKRF